MIIETAIQSAEIMIPVLNSINKKVCEIDHGNLIVEIIQKGIYSTVIRFDPQSNRLVVINRIKRKAN